MYLFTQFLTIPYPSPTISLIQPFPLTYPTLPYPFFPLKELRGLAVVDTVSLKEYSARPIMKVLVTP